MFFLTSKRKPTKTTLEELFAFHLLCVFSPPKNEHQQVSSDFRKTYSLKVTLEGILATKYQLAGLSNKNTISELHLEKISKKSRDSLGSRRFSPKVPARQQTVRGAGGGVGR